MTDTQCKTCRFYLANADDFVGTCRRMPPTVMMSPEGPMHSTWPSTGASAWCGEHQTRVVARARGDETLEEAAERRRALLQKLSDGTDFIDSDISPDMIAAGAKIVAGLGAGTPEVDAVRIWKAMRAARSEDLS